MINDANVTIMVSDIDAAIRFYVEKLGLKFVANYGGHYAEISAPSLKIGLHPAGEAGPKMKSGNLSIGFEVENLDVAVSELKNKGVTIERIVEDGPVRLAHFADPDGNPLYLAQQQTWSR